MYILGNKWTNGYLDYYKPDGHVRIQVRAWWRAVPIADLYAPQPRNLRRLWNYLKQVGPRMVLRKVVARSAERLRNNKSLAIGAGTVIEAPANGSPCEGTSVVFIAPCHPPCVERVVLPPQLMTPVEPALLDRIAVEGGITYTDGPVEQVRYDDIAGWTEHSGKSLPGSVRFLLQDAVERWRTLDLRETRVLNLPRSTAIREAAALRKQASNEKSKRKLDAVLFGFGNQAKVVVLPNLHRKARLASIHELDPTQMRTARSRSGTGDTAYVPRASEEYDVYLIAGYHHTHAPLAVHALDRGAWAVVEKPLVTTWRQLDSLVEAMERNPGRLFAGFQMRYDPAWKWAREDLGVKNGEPIHYHCIVYEVPVPDRNWYNWPNARSRLVSNGCHWIDHFLHINNFSKPGSYDLWKAKNGDIHASIELENGAVFGLHLTDHGSKRIGMRQHVELRANGVTVKVENAGRYVSEDGDRILRKRRTPAPPAVYRAMYQSIWDRIIRGEQADDVASTKVSCEAMLTLDDMYSSFGTETARSRGYKLAGALWSPATSLAS